MKPLMILLCFVFTLSFLQANDRGLMLKKMKAEQRLALVVGNNDYEHLSKLKNPINDAKAMKDALIKRGFEVIYKENANKKDMKKLLAKFAYKLKPEGVGLYFFAGHGVNVEGNNYLVATDSIMDSKEDVEFETYALNRITKKMKAANNRLNIVILDACRNDPFSRSGGGGLAPVGNAKGMFVAYATEAGSVASDGGDGVNGIFTKYLIEHMEEKGATIERVFKNVRASVINQTEGKQSPGVYNQITGDFYFSLPEITTDVLIDKGRVTKSTTFAFSDTAPRIFSLTVNAIPSDATIEVNSTEPYHAGMKLQPASYKVIVRKEGFYTQTGEVNLESDISLNINLKKREGIYLDTTHKLIWQDNIAAKTLKLNWKAAMKYCKDLDFDSSKEWYLPSLKELESLQAQKENLKFVSADRYWTSIEDSSDKSEAIVSMFVFGDSYSDSKEEKDNVRCVRVKK